MRFFRLSALGLVALAATNCLWAYAPNIEATDHHATLMPSDSLRECMSCHQAVSGAQQPPRARSAELQPAPKPKTERYQTAPLVMDWMLEDGRRCLHCHGLAE